MQQTRRSLLKRFLALIGAGSMFPFYSNCSKFQTGANLDGESFASKAPPFQPELPFYQEPPVQLNPGSTSLIGYANGQHPISGLKATLEEISPKYMSFNPALGTEGPWGGTPTTLFMNSITAYCGVCPVPSLGKVVSLGGGHAAYSVEAPYAFDWNSVSWSWLHAPPPADSFSKLLSLGLASTVENIAAQYPADQFDVAEGTWLGDWSGWPAGFRQPGRIFPEVGHSYFGTVWVPGPSVGNTNGIILYLVPPSGKGAEGFINTRHYLDLDDMHWKLTPNRRSNAYAACGGSIYFGGDIDRVFSITNTSSTLRRTLDVFIPSSKTWVTHDATADLTILNESGGLGAHLNSGLLMYFCPANSAGVETYVNATQFHIYAVSAASAATGPHTWTKLSVNASSWPVKGIDGGGAQTVGTVGWTYCPRNACFYAVNGRNGSNVIYKLSPPTSANSLSEHLSGEWTVTTETVSPGIPSYNQVGVPADNVNIYNRLVWVEELGFFLYFDGWYQSQPVAIRPVGF